MLALLAPLVAMQVTSEINWAPGDFLVAALLLGIAGLALELLTRLLRLPVQRWLGAGLVLLALLLVWAELAVGIFR